ncbi:MAG: class I SAM-dependent methyltransferase [Methylocella sp.]
MSFEGHLDEAGEFVLHGWAHSCTIPELVIHVDIVINGRLAGRTRAGNFRADLQVAGKGDGRKAFWFNPFDHWTQHENLVEIFISGTDHVIWDGRQLVKASTLAEHTARMDAKYSAEARWRGDEHDASLTWGNIMTGDTFIGQVERLFGFTLQQRVLEIGPGYGRLLKTLVQRGHPFEEFVGLDLSSSRISRLSAQFGAPHIKFIVGDCDSYIPDGLFDIILSSSTFEHIFPSVQQSLRNIYSCLKPKGMAFIDFISADDSLGISRAHFESEAAGGAFIRIYSRDEIHALFAAADLKIVDVIHPLILGDGAGNRPIKRALVAAIKRG